ncbi:MAG: ATP-binding protein [Caldimonas sp.]
MWRDNARSTPAARSGIRAFARLAWLCLALFGAVAGAASAGSEDDSFEIDEHDPRFINQAELAIVDSATPPPDSAAWRPVHLPDSWRPAERYRQGNNGWYRFRLAGSAPVEPHSVYLWRFSMNAAVYFNGELLGDGGSFEEPIARNWNRPLIFRLPQSMWRTDGNELQVRLRVYPGFGHMMPIAVGPTALLQPDHERRHFAQVTVSQVAATVMALALLTGLALWAIDRCDRTYLFFAGSCAALLVYSLNKFLQDVPMSARAWWWLIHSAVDATSVFLVAFIHRALGVRRPRLERAMLAVLLLFMALYAFWDLPQLAAWNPVTHGIASLAGLYLLGWLGLRMVRRPAVDTALYGLLVLSLMAAGIYDQLLNSLLFPDLWRGGFYLLTLTMPALLLALMCHLGLRSMRAVQGLRVANETLEGRVREASTEIEATYARERRLLAERSAGQERERIYRDLHDNLGARLLSLVYGARDDRQRALAREALSEMRTIVAASQLDAGQLADLAEEWRLEAELRCEDASHELGWTCEGDARLSGRQRYQLERIVRELISNALEHAGGRRIDVAWSLPPGRLALRVGDDGRGMPGGAAPASVVARAADLQGSAHWESRPGGGSVCVVTIDLPATPAEPREASP